MNHLVKIQQLLPAYGIDAMMVSSTPGEFYSIGFRGEGILIVTEKVCRYYTDSRYMEAARKQVENCEIFVTAVAKNFLPMIRSAVTELGITKMGIEDGYMTVQELRRYESAVDCALLPCQNLLASLRASKDKEEIQLMQQSQDITDRAFSQILEYLRPGMTEREIAARLQYNMLCLGANKISFNPIVVTGRNGSLPHGIPGDTKIESGQFLTMDFGCIYKGYCSDMTRTIAIGEPSEEMRLVYQTVLQAQSAGIAASRAGVTGKSIDAAARRVIDDAGYGEYFVHGYGHSLGIEGKELPLANTMDETPMPVGAVVSAEPGIYLPGRFGVRIEDVIVMTENGCIDLTHSPKELIIV
ncbi:MAG: aminopeptidase P family protein [Clostridiales bacterium]|nr:aminopeptidase P family protein [Clostridiales bacterium]